MSNQFADKFGRDIRDLKVYDPKSDGITFQKWPQGHEALRAIQPRFEYLLSEALYLRVHRDKVAEGLSLKDYLEGFFEAQPASMVVFVDGRFHSQYAEPYTLDGEALARETNSVPLMFHHPIETDEIEVQEDVKRGLGF